MLRQLLPGSRHELIVFVVAVTLAVLSSRHAYPEAALGANQLQLEVYINELPTGLIGSFVQLSDKRMAARSTELTELGIKPASSAAGDKLVILEDIPGLTYRYEEAEQKLFFTAGDERLVTKVYDVRGKPQAVAPARADFGAVVNYVLFASSMANFPKSAFAFSGANASIDARLFGPYGTLSQTAILGSTLAREADALRLDTTWAYSDPQSMKTYRAGDVISGGLAWTRPIRLGGVQAQRNFALRPDLVTVPLPAISGSAAVPSTLDVYVNNLKVHTQDVPPGPYQITNIPVLTGAGDARVVLRDSSGRPTELNMPFFASPRLLQPGLTDFSLEAGLPRLGYGTDSSSYLEDPVGSATLRAGIHDWLTAETHFETGMRVVNGGAGILARVGAVGVISVAGTASQLEHDRGYQSYFAFDTQIGNINLHVSSQHTFGSYRDLASATAFYLPVVAPAPATSYFAGFFPSAASARPPRFIDTVSVGVPLFNASTVSLTFLHVDLNDSKPSDILNVSYSRPVLAGGSAYVTAFKDFNDRKSFGAFVGLSIPIGNKATASAGVSRTREGTSYTFDAIRSLGAEPGSYGWRVRGSEGSATYYAGGASYRSSAARFDADVLQTGAGTSGSVQAEGAVAAMGGGVFLANRINDAFAVVDAGAPNVDVLYENRPAGKTDAQGRILLPSLRSYQANKITIDPQGLPLNAEAPDVQHVVAPADRSGVVVRFGVKTEVSAAVLILTRRDGSFIPAGTSATLAGSSEAFVVGYDGRAYVTGLGAANTVAVDDPAGQCRASFPFAPKRDAQVVIGPLRCQ
jgi:outer membrane usher protein